MFKEINLYGIYFPPFFGILAWASLLYFPLGRWLDRIPLERWVWHRALFKSALFVILLFIVGLLGEIGT